MTRLQAYRGELFFELDVPDQTIELNFQAEDFRSPGSRLAPFSLTFGLPFTYRNKSFFGFVDELSVQDSNFDMLQKTEARILDDGVEVLEGILQLKNIDLNKQLFNCSFYSVTVDFFQTIRGKRWRELWTDDLGNIDCPLDHTLNSTNVLAAWAGQNIPGTNVVDVPNGTIQYPLTDNGNAPFAGYQVRADALQRWGGNEGLVPTNLHPAIKVGWLLDALFQYSGYTRTADDFFNDTTLNNDNLYIHVGLQSKTIDTRPSFGFQVTTILVTANIGFPESYLLTPWNTTSGSNYDPDDLWAGITYVTFNLVGTYVINVNIFNSQNLGGQWNSTFTAFTGDGSQVIDYPFQMGQADNGTGVNFNIQIPFSGPPQLWFFSLTTQADANLTVTLTYLNLVGNTAVDGVLDFATIMGEEPLDKWVKGLVETYNLVLKIDEQNKQATFVPYDTFIQSGRSLDWTDRIDLDGEMKVYPATEYQKSRVKFLPAETNDHRSIYYTSLFGVRKGQFEYVAQNDFATGEHLINDFFGLARLTYLKWQTNPANGQTITTQGEVNTPVIIRELWKSSASYETEYESLPPMLLYYHGNQSTVLTLGGVDYPVQFADGTVFTAAPLMTPVSGIATDTNRISLEYALTAPDLADTTVIGNPTSGLLESYWGNYLQSIYGSGARVVECKMLLSPIDIYRLDFGDEIIIKNIAYRLLSINSYVVGQYAPVSVTLFKSARGNLYDCGLRPFVQNNGLVLWYDEDGFPTEGNALCCQGYGWDWDPFRRSCTVVSRRTVDTYGYDTGFASPGQRSNSLGICRESQRTVISNYLEGDIIEETWQMINSTTDENNTPAKTLALEQIDFLVGADRSCSVTVDWLAVQTSGSNKGDSSSGQEATLINTVSATSSAFSGSIYSRGATGLGVTILTSDGSDGSKWRINCAGLVGTNIDWFINVTVKEYDQGGLSVRIPPYAAFQNLDIYEFQDGDEMEWNA